MKECPKRTPLGVYNAWKEKEKVEGLNHFDVWPIWKAFWPDLGSTSPCSMLYLLKTNKLSCWFYHKTHKKHLKKCWSKITKISRIFE